MMPRFFVFFIILRIRVATLPGAVEGYKYMFVPKWDQLEDIKTWVYALGQCILLTVSGRGSGHNCIRKSILKKTWTEQNALKKRGFL